MYLIVNVHQPKDRVTINHQGYGFVEFLTEEDADYAIKIMNMIKLYGKPIRVNKVRRKKDLQIDLVDLFFLGFNTSEKSRCWCEFIYW
jgi:RNA recognition motif-containing protein